MPPFSRLALALLISGAFIILPYGRTTAVASQAHDAFNSVQSEEVIVATGVMKSRRTSMLGPVVPGVLEQTFVKVGDIVTKGQALFRIRPVDYDIAVRKAKAALDLARARVVLQNKRFDRVSELFKDKNVSESALEEARASLDVALAEQALAQTDLDNAEQILSDTIIRAPYDGVITKKVADEGVFKTVQAFSGNGGVVELQEAGIMVAILFVPVSQTARIELGQKTLLSIDGLDQRFTGEIAVINHQAHVSSNMLEVRVAVINDGLAIKDGQTVVARIYAAEQVSQ